MLKVENISSGYAKKQVLYNVSLQVGKGEVVLLTGGNGSGKSTLLKCIYNLLPCWTGDIFYEGERINGLKTSDLIQRGIIYIPQKDFYFENLTVDENLRIAGNIYQKNDLKERLNEVYMYSGLLHLKKRKPFNLSGGEKKIIAFGMCLMHKPKFILFDEPFAGVDENKAQDLVNLFNSHFLQNGISLVIVEHKDTGEKLYTTKIIMELGKIKR